MPPAQGEAHRPESLADTGEVLSPAGVARKKDRSARPLEHEPAPQSGIAIAQSASRKMPCGNAGDAQRPRPGSVPPVELDRTRNALRRQESAQAERHDHPRTVDGRQPAQCHNVQVIVVIVAQQHEIDMREILESQAGSAVPARAREPDGACALAPDRVGQHIHLVHLDEYGAVVHVCDAQVANDALGRRTGRRIEPLRPGCGIGRAAPSNQIPQSAFLKATRIVKPLAVEMVRARAPDSAARRKDPSNRRAPERKPLRRPYRRKRDDESRFDGSRLTRSYGALTGNVTMLLVYTS